ncbi:MAG: hypothetical protein ACM3S1_06730 [Hyphomicrobiales bacterium]
MRTRMLPRVALGAATLSILLGAFLLMPLAANAAPVRITCKWSGNDYKCAQSCTQTLSDGATVYYEDGTEITIVTADGKTTKFKCKDGTWVQTALVSNWTIGTLAPITSVTFP